MPISQEQFKALPKVTEKTKRKGGQKVDWESEIYPSLRGQGWLVAEVYKMAMKVAQKGGHTISRVRTKRWLDSLVEKKKAELAEDGIAFIYYVK